MDPISALIVDDEPLARERLRGMLQAEPGIDIIGECENGADALVAIRHAQPDLVFLDMQMPGCDGLQLIARLPADERPVIIFATAHERFALDAFDVAAADYLLKPFDRDRLRVALDRAGEHLRLRAADEPVGKPEAAGPGQKNGRLVVKADGRIVFLRTEEVIWIEADDNHVVLHLPDNRLLVRETLAAFEARLGSASFVRVNRSALVNIDQIKELQPAMHHGDYIVLLRDGTKLPLSRGMRGRLDHLGLATA